MSPPQRLAIVLALVLLGAPSAWAQSGTHLTGREAPGVQLMDVEEDSDFDGWDDSLTDAQIEEMRRLNAEIELARLRRRVASGEVKLTGTGPSVGRTGDAITIRMPPGSSSARGSKGKSKASARPSGTSKSKSKSKSGSRSSASKAASKSTSFASRSPSKSSSSSRPASKATSKTASKPAASKSTKTSPPAQKPAPAPSTAKRMPVKVGR